LDQNYNKKKTTVENDNEKNLKITETKKTKTTF